MTFFSSEKAVSEVIGQVLVLGLTVTGIAMISLVGLPTIYSMQDMATVGNAEQAFTVMDSRISAVALGNTPVQLIDINLGGGTLAIESNETDRESYIEVNIAGDILPVPMGKVKYQLGERIVAYEGGGIWSKYPSGGSVMLSPPEFHYNGVTLTLPVINITGSGSTGGSGSATLRLKKNGDPDIKYPDTDNNRTNPVNGSGNDTVYVNITSDFYDAWADYARSLGYTIVTEDAENNKVSIKLTVVPTTLGMNTSITNPIAIRGLGDEANPLSEFNLRFEATNNNEFNSLNWQLTMRSGTKTWIIHIDGAADDEADIGIAYEDTSLGSTNNSEIWKKVNAFPAYGSGADAYIDVDLLNQSINLTYMGVNVGSTQGDCKKIQQQDLNPSGVTENPPSDNKSLYNIMQHYTQWFAPDIGLAKCSPGGSDPVDYGDSTLLLNYTSQGALTYLHVSDNIAVVDIV